MNRLGLLLRLFVSLIAPTLAPLSSATEPGSPGLIAFAVRRWEGEYQSRDVPGGVETTPVVGSIHVVGLDGSGPRKIVELGRDSNAPEFSPDGRWLYFQSNASGTFRIYRCRPDGSGLAPIISPEAVGTRWKSVFGLAVAGDGRLIFTVHDGQAGHVAIADADGSRPTVLAPDAGYLYMAALSPTGDTVVCSGPAGGYRLQRIRLWDETPILLTPDHPESFCPQFTPDGKTIVFFRRDGDFYRVDVDGRNLRRLTVGAHHVEFRLSARDRHGSSDAPQISPDGRRIAYIAERDGVPNVHVMNLDGSNQRPLTARKSPCARVRWSPDGRRIAFVSFEGKYSQLFVIPADGGTPRQLTKVDGAVYFVCWQPETKKCVVLPSSRKEPLSEAGQRR
jgi:Tol biopolymer transport system component